MALNPKHRPIVASEAAPSLRERAEKLRSRVPEPAADPVLAEIEVGRALIPAARRAYKALDARDEVGEFTHSTAAPGAIEALFEHFRGPLLEAKPTTPAGAVALARYTVEFRKVTDYHLADEAPAILDLIARVPMA